VNAYLFKLIFDVNGTLLDLASVCKSADEASGEPGAAALWFSSLLYHSLVMTSTEQYAEFSRISSGLLQVLGRQHGRTSGHGAGRGALAPMTQL